MFRLVFTFYFASHPKTYEIDDNFASAEKVKKKIEKSDLLVFENVTLEKLVELHNFRNVVFCVQLTNRNENGLMSFSSAEPEITNFSRNIMDSLPSDECI